MDITMSTLPSVPIDVRPNGKERSPSSHHTSGDEEHMEVIKVSANSRSTAVAGAIAGVIREAKTAEVQAIGASAVNQAVKAIAIARGYLELDGIDIFCVPSFTEVDIDGNERTAVRISVDRR